MASTARSEDEITEYYDEPEVFEEKLDRLAELVRNSRQCVFFTGAGISTSAGIPDFRGPQGVWTLKAKGEVPDRTNRPAQPVPTLTHMGIVELMRVDRVKYLVSQNCDGLHVKSGVPPARISELHGNKNVEACSRCGELFYRNFPVRKDRTKARITGRFCDSCGTQLRYTTVAFGQSMPDMCFERAEEMASGTDVAICMGTSMTVSPACDLPNMVKKNKGHLVIVNLQTTPYDNVCAKRGIRIFGRTDAVMKGLLDRLGLEAPQYRDLDLVNDAAWMAAFKADYVFRRPSEEWFTGGH